MTSVTPAHELAGHHWDAIQTPAVDGALLQIRYQAPAITDRLRRTVTWLVPRGAAGGWELPVVARVLPAGEPLVVPPATWIGPADTRGVERPIYWTADPTDGGGLVPAPAMLEAALARLLILGRRTPGPVW